MGLTIDHIDIVTHQYYHIWDTIDVDNTSVSCNKQFIWYVPTQPSNCQDRLPGVELHPMDYADWTYSPSHSIDHCAWLSRRSLYVHLAVWHTSLFGCQMPNPKSFPSSKRGSKGVSAKDWELCPTHVSWNSSQFLESSCGYWLDKNLRIINTHLLWKQMLSDWRRFSSTI